MNELILMCLFVICGCLLALYSNDNRVSVVLLAVAGYGIAIMLILLKAYQAAFVQLSAEVILLAALVSVTKNDKTSSFAPMKITLRGLIAILFGIVLLAAISNQLGLFGDISLVGEITDTDHRGFDEIISVMALAAASVGSIAVLRQKGKQ